MDFLRFDRVSGRRAEDRVPAVRSTRTAALSSTVLLLFSGYFNAALGVADQATGTASQDQQATPVTSGTAIEQEQSPPRGATSSSPYVLQRGDDLEVRVFDIPELNAIVKIRPDGKISLVLLNDVDAAGLTVEQLAKFLKDNYAKQFRNPRVTVMVKSFSNQSVYVGGEVTRPGPVPLGGDLTVVKALFNAGGLRDTARASDVMLLRGGDNGNTSIISLNLDEVLTHGKPDVPLNPSDILYVPKAEISVYVGGEVTKPGLVPLYGRLTALAAVFEAGGFKETARASNVMLLRNDGNGGPLVVKLRLDDAMKGKPDTVLQPYDVVYVPKSRIAKADRFVDQYIKQLLPVYVNAGFSYLFGGTLH